MASKGSKSKENTPSIVSKSATDTKTKTTSPHSSNKTAKTKLGAAEKQKIEEEILAKEQEELRRAAPDEFGISLNDYSELLSCPAERISDTCARIFGYKNTSDERRSVALNNIYARTIYDLRSYALDETVLKRLGNIFLGLLKVFSMEFLNMSEVLDVMGSGYASLLQPPSVLSNKIMQEIISFFTDTYIINYNLFRFVMTTDVPPMYKVAKITVRQPNPDPFSCTTLCPLAEAIPQKEEKISPTLITGPNFKASDMALHKKATEILSHAGEMAKSVVPAVADTQTNTFPSGEDVQRVVDRVAKLKLSVFRKKIEDAIKRREKILIDKFAK